MPILHGSSDASKGEQGTSAQAQRAEPETPAPAPRNTGSTAHAPTNDPATNPGLEDAHTQSQQTPSSGTLDPGPQNAPSTFALLVQLSNQVTQLQRQVIRLQKELTESRQASSSQQQVQQSPSAARTENGSQHSVEQICLQHKFTHFPHENCISCDVCFKFGKLNETLRAGDNAGVISTVQTQGISAINRNVARHCETRVHKWCIEWEHQLAQTARRNKSIGVAVARCAYFCIREAMSGLSFERRLLEEHYLGVQVGSMNHSEKFLTGFMESLHLEIIDSFMKFLRKPDVATNRQPPFALLADKVTENRRTGQTTGALVIEKGVIKAFFLANPVVSKGHTGYDIALNLKEGLSEYGFDEQMWHAQWCKL